MASHIASLQEQFSDAISERAAESLRRRQCQGKGDLLGERRCLDRMKDLGVLAVDIQRSIGEVLANWNSGIINPWFSERALSFVEAEIRGVRPWLGREI